MLTHSHYREGCGAVRRSTSTGSSPSTNFGTSWCPSGAGSGVGPGAGGRLGARGGAAAQLQGGAGHHALPGAVARPLICRGRLGEWLRAADLSLGHCQGKVTEYEAAAPRRRAARRSQVGSHPNPLAPPPQAGDPLPLRAPSGFRLAGPGEVCGGAALAGSQVLYLWPAEGSGWLQGRVRRVCTRPGFSRVVGYPASSRFGAAEVETLLDEASHGPTGRWLLLVPAGQRHPRRSRVGG